MWAKTCAVNGKTRKAIRWLRELEERGVLSHPRRKLLEDFPSLVGDPEFEAVVDKAKKRAEAEE